MKRLILKMLFIFYLPVFGSEAPYVIDLKSTISLTLSKNIDVQVIKLKTQEKNAVVTQKKGEFDVNISTSITEDHDKVPTSSVLDGVGAGSSLDTKYRTISATLSKKFASGTTISIPYSSVRTESNSSNVINSVLYRPTIEVEISQPLLRSLFTSYTTSDLKQAELEALASLSSEKEEIRSQLLKTIGIYLNAQSSQKKYLLAQSKENSSRELLEFVQKKHKVGKANSIEVLEAKSQYETSVEQRIQSEGSLKKQLLEIRHALLLPENKQILLTQNLESKVIEISKEQFKFDLKNALKTREEINKHNFLIEQSQLAYDKSEVDLYPNVDINYGIGYSGLATNSSTAHSNLFDGKFNSWDTSLSISYPFFNRAARGSNSLKKLKLHQAQLKKKQTLNKIEIEITKAFYSVKANRQRVKALYRAKETESEKIKAQRLRHQRGQISTYDLLVSENEYFKVENDWLKAQIESLLSDLEYLNAINKPIENI